MKTPAFWQTDNLISRILSPLGALYNFATQRRITRNIPRKVGIPVICLGNLTAGGTGKTPTAISIAELLQTSGKHPSFITRGYHGKASSVLVDTAKHTPRQVGDEPLLLARAAPTYVNPDRFVSAQTAEQNGADCLIMDDGFQNPGLFKDLSFIVIDGGYGFGNYKCIPAGPLREYVHNGIKRAQGVIIIGSDRHNVAQQINLPVFYGTISPQAHNFSGKKVVAFAGIGRPQKFYNSLTEENIEIIKTFDFPDHHYYTEKELKEILDFAQKNNAQAITTSKDFVKIPEHLKHFFNVFEITIKWQDPQSLKDFILSYINQK